MGLQCRHMRLNSDNHYVCGISGQVLGVKAAYESYPGSTGRSTKSANPDDSAGVPVGGWVKRRDMYAASVAAFRNSHAISDAEIMPVHAVSSAMLPPIKRGALCVDEQPDANATPKKTRNSRKENWTRDSIDKLAAEALLVIDKLFIASRKPQAPEPPPTDPRLQNLEFVKGMAIRKYVKRCVRGRERVESGRAQQRDHPRQLSSCARSARRRASGLPRPRGGSRPSTDARKRASRGRYEISSVSSSCASGVRAA